MNSFTKRTAAFVSAMVLCAAAFGHYPVCRQNADAKAPSVRDFADSVLPNLPAQPDTVFESLFYNKKANRLLRDGEAVTGDSFSGFRVIDGELRIAASQTVRAGEKADGTYLPLEEAASRIGLETYETEDGIYVSNPFRSGTLIVRTEDLSDTMGASEIGAGWDGLHVLQYQTAADAYAAYQAFQADSDVVYAEPNRVYHTCEVQGSSAEYPFPSDNWGWRAVGADDFLENFEESAVSAPDVVAAVIDTGLYAEHDWFQGRIADGGTSFIRENNSSFDDLHGHGTHCAGIICGMTPDNVKILPLKALNENGYGESLGIYCAMMYAAEQNADVVSMSLGGDGCSPMFEEAVRALKEKQIPCVVAAGNETNDARYHSPANIPDAITVSSVSLAREDDYAPDKPEKDIDVRGYVISAFSNFGEGIDFAAPGEDINSAYVTSADDTTEMSGTSMATPHVAGCVADILTLQNDYTVDDVYECLRVNASDRGTPGFDTYFGWGIVNIGSLDFTQSSLPCPEISKNSGTFDRVFGVTFFTSEPDAEIRYTLDGTIPDADTGILYRGGEIMIDNTTELCAVTVKNGERSACARRRYIFYLDSPTAYPEPGCYDYSLDVRLEGPYNTDIYYTLDGSDPSLTNGFLYTSSIIINKSTVVKASSVVGRYVSEPGIFCYTIDGVPCDDAFEIEDGVLTHYYGNDANLDLTDYFESGSITKIGDHAFSDNQSLVRLTLPESVKTLGKYAFSECRSLSEIHAPGVETVEPYCFHYTASLRNVDLPALKRIEAHGFDCGLGEAEQVFPKDNQIEEIGNHAFESSDLVNAEFPNLKKLGEGAFGYCYELKSVTLPENITVLPNLCFVQCLVLETFDAPGVTEIGDYALYLSVKSQSNLETCTIDFSKVTSIGADSLSIFKRPEIMEHVSFDSLTHIGQNAFDFFSAKEISLPLLKEVPAYAFWNAECDAVYLEQAEKLEQDALTTNPAWGNHISFVFGDRISVSQPNPLTSDTQMITVAAPEDSPMRLFADNADIPFCAAPDIYIPSELDTVRQYDFVCLKKCIPLAFGAKLTFTALDTEYASGYDAPAQPLSADYTGALTMLDTSVPGTVTVKIDMTDAAGTVLTSKTQEIRIKSAESADFVSEEGVVILDWTEGVIREDKPESIFSMPDLLAYYEFSFRPETDGEYYFIPEDAEFSIYVRNSRNEMIGGAAAREDYEELDGIEPVKMKAGETYLVTAETRSDMIVNNRYTGILITQQMPTLNIENDCGIFPYQYIVDKNEPFTPDITVEDYTSFDWETGHPKLKENVDYRMERLKFGESETIYIFGMGSHYGVHTISVYAYEDYKIGEAFDLPEIQPGETLVYRITDIEEDDMYAFCVDPSDAYLNAYAAGEIDGDPTAYAAMIDLRDEEFAYISPELNTYYLFAENTYDLTAGKTYYLTVNYYPMTNENRVAYAPDGMLAISSRKGDLSKWIVNCNVSIRQSVPYTGKQPDHLCSITDENGYGLEEGKDYLIYAPNTVLPGGSQIIVKCIGDYFGFCSGNVEVKSPAPNDKQYAAEPVRVQEPFTVREKVGFFELNTDSTYSLKLRKTDSSAPDAKYYYYVQAYSEDVFDWETICAGDQSDSDMTMKLQPGTYRIYIAQETENQEYILDALKSAAGIGLADIRTEPLYYTGEALSPQMTLTYDGKTLTEGKDYLVVYPDEPILSCGIYFITVMGIGDFSAERTVRIVVKEAEQSAQNAASDGKNTAAVTSPEQVAYMEWSPEHSHYGVAINELPLVSLVIYDTETDTELFSLNGNGYLSDTVDVTPGRKYLICASYYNPVLTGEIHFDLVPDCTDLSDCTAEGASQIMFMECGAKPEVTVRNGETVLQQGTDYDIYYCGGNIEPGHAVMILTGKGNYIGSLTYEFFLSPALDADAFDQNEKTTTLTVNEAANPLVKMSGDTEQFVFEAPADGTYTIDRPDPLREGIAVFVYGADQELLPLDAETVAMTAGQKLRFFAVSEHLEETMNTDYQYTLAVYDSTQAYELTVDDCVYQIRDGAAYLHQYHGENTGIQLPETVYDSEQDANIPVTGCTAELIAEIGASKTIYIKTADGFMMPEGGCYALPDPQTGVSGDITGDGITDVNDWLTLTRCLTECPGMLLHESAIAAGDVNGDGSLDMLDAEALRKMITETEL